MNDEEATVVAKLERLGQCLARVESKRPFSAERLATDMDLQDVVSINLERALQQCLDLASMAVAAMPVPPASSAGATFDVLAQAGCILPETARRMRRATAFRNLLVHAYERVDWRAVHGFLDTSISDLRAFARELHPEHLRS